jgi:quercetin 2,3-dioxygenase
VGRDHDEITEARADWMAQISDNAGVIADSAEIYDGRFGIVGDHLPPVPAPPLPNVRLKARR